MSARNENIKATNTVSDTIYLKKYYLTNKEWLIYEIKIINTCQYKQQSLADTVMNYYTFSNSCLYMYLLK